MDSGTAELLVWLGTGSTLLLATIFAFWLLGGFRD